MHAFWEIVASNSLVVAVLAVGVGLLGRIWKNPVALHLLWVLVLLKFVTPPVVTVHIALPMSQRPTALGQRATNREVAHQAPGVVPGSEIASAKDYAFNARPADDQAMAGSRAVGTDIRRLSPKRPSVSWLAVLAWTWAPDSPSSPPVTPTASFGFGDYFVLPKPLLPLCSAWRRRSASGLV